MSTVFVRRLSRWQAETEREDVADLYVEATGDAPGLAPPDREQFLDRFVDHDVQQPGFDLVLACDPDPVGFAYGFRVDRGGSWWEAYAGVPAELGEPTRVRQIFLVAGLVTAPRRRRRGVATRALRELLTRSDATVALALVEPDNAPAAAAFHSWDWSKAGQLTPVDGGAPRQAWTRRLAA